MEPDHHHPIVDAIMAVAIVVTFLWCLVRSKGSPPRQTHSHVDKDEDHPPGA